MAQIFETSPRTAAPAGYAHVALEQGIDIHAAGLTYEVPAKLADLAVGDRVLVPLGRSDRPVAGYVVDRSDDCDLEARLVKPILCRDPQRLSLPVDLIELARWISGYYCCPLGMVFATMLPAAVKHGTGVAMRTVVRLAREEPTAPVSKLQQAVLDQARRAAQTDEPWVQIKELADLAGARTVSSVKQLILKGWLTAERQETVVSDLDLRASRVPETAPPLLLNRSQQQALDHLLAHAERGFGVHLLYGVTGSGKTEVYLRLIEQILKSKVGGQDQAARQPIATTGAARLSRPAAPGVIMLVPEIVLTPQTVAHFVRRFDSVAVLHSGLTAAQRHAQWRMIRNGKASIVVGARSAVFAPMPNLALIVVDEEHEHTYKQDQLPRYHARDVAIKRGQLRSIPVVLGSATPSLESFYNAAHRRNYHLLKLPQRVVGMKLPQVEIVDMTEERRKRNEYSGKAGVHLLSVRLEMRLRQTLAAGRSARGGQVMLLLNRRGYANYIACPDHRCGWMLRCNYCDATMVYHKDLRLPTGGLVRCHHCDAEQLLPVVCPSCGKRVSVFGLGTQRVEEELVRKFPGLRVARMDSDSMRTSSDYEQALDRFRAGEIKVLLGTQMIAKGLDFPGVGLVGVISGDTCLHLPDFRAAERTFQLIAQVAGRAGRSDLPGRVIVQTFNPRDPAIALAAQHDYEGFAARESELRQEVGLPPVTRMARIVVREKDHLACHERAQTLAGHLDAFNRKLELRVRLRGPMPCPIARIAEFHRYQIEMISPDAASLQQLITALRNARLLVSDAQTAVDVDPVAML